MNELTPDEQTIRDTLIRNGEEIKRLNEEFKQLQKTCPHRLRPISDKARSILRERPWDASYKDSIAMCMICDRYFGHRCSDSPDGVCHYYSTDQDGKRVVQLIDYTYHVLDNYTEEEWVYESVDVCIFCGFPEERK